MIRLDILEWLAGGDNEHCVTGPDILTRIGTRTKVRTSNMTGPGPRLGPEI